MSDDFVFKPVTDVSDLSDKKLPDLQKQEEKALARKAREEDENLPKFDKDFDFARENIKEIIEQGGPVLDELIKLAKASDHPRAYEVVSTLMRTLIDANKDIIEVHERKAKIKGNAKDPQPGTTTNNNAFFVGSTKDMAEFIRQQNEKQVIENNNE